MDAKDTENLVCLVKVMEDLPRAVERIQKIADAHYKSDEADHKSFALAISDILVRLQEIEDQLGITYNAEQATG